MKNESVERSEALEYILKNRKNPNLQTYREIFELGKRMGRIETMKMRSRFNYFHVEESNIKKLMKEIYDLDV